MKYIHLILKYDEQLRFCRLQGYPTLLVPTASQTFSWRDTLVAWRYTNNEKSYNRIHPDGLVNLAVSKGDIPLQRSLS